MNGAAVAIPGLPAPGAGMMYVINSFALELLLTVLLSEWWRGVLTVWLWWLQRLLIQQHHIAGTGVTARWLILVQRYW